MKKAPKYEIVNIRPRGKIVENSRYRFIESDWMVFVDGPSKTAWKVNRKTGERRPYDYAKAMREILT